MSPRRLALCSIVLVVSVGLWTKAYRGLLEVWVNDSLGGVFYEVFWCLAALVAVPRAPAWKVAVTVLATTCALEVLQLWSPALLAVTRTHFIGATLLGTTFSWLDFPHYLLGCSLGWAWMIAIQRRA